MSSSFNKAEVKFEPRYVWLQSPCVIHCVIVFHMDPWLENLVLWIWRFMVPNISLYLLTTTIVLKDLISTLGEAWGMI